MCNYRLQRPVCLNHHTLVIGTCQPESLENAKSLSRKDLRRSRPARFALSLYLAMVYGGWEIRTPEVDSQQIYSLPSLSTWVIHQQRPRELNSHRFYPARFSKAVQQTNICLTSKYKLLGLDSNQQVFRRLINSQLRLSISPPSIKFRSLGTIQK